jgi:hypothetical protein
MTAGVRCTVDGCMQIAGDLCRFQNLGSQKIDASVFILHYQTMTSHSLSPKSNVRLSKACDHTQGGPKDRFLPVSLRGQSGVYAILHGACKNNPLLSFRQMSAHFSHKRKIETTDQTLRNISVATLPGTHESGRSRGPQAFRTATRAEFRRLRIQCSENLRLTAGVRCAVDSCMQISGDLCRFQNFGSQKIDASVFILDHQTMTSHSFLPQVKVRLYEACDHTQGDPIDRSFPVGREGQCGVYAIANEACKDNLFLVSPTFWAIPALAGNRTETDQAASENISVAKRLRKW